VALFLNVRRREAEGVEPVPLQVMTCYDMSNNEQAKRPQNSVQLRSKNMSNLLTILPKVESWKKRKDEHRIPYQGVVKHDWVATGRIDFATQLNGNDTESDQPSEFKLLVEERRIVESIAGNENLEIQWRLATLREAKAVVTQYHKYLSENSLFKTVREDTISLPSQKTIQ
jgi:hypothetical protein